MRTTIDIPEELRRITMSLANHTGRTLSQTVVALIERGLAAPPAAHEASPAAAPAWRRHPATGLPVARSRRTVTPEDVGEADDE